MIDIHDDGDVRYLTLNRPKNMNALNSTVLQALASHVANSEHDRVGCLVIRGAGDKAFCAGADLGEIEGLDVDSAHAFIRRGHQTMNGIEDSAVPAIASVDGYALGGGFDAGLSRGHRQHSQQLRPSRGKHRMHARIRRYAAADDSNRPRPRIPSTA
jgi:enoyl-CoA hydratase